MNESKSSGVNGLPKHLELLLETLVSHNEITSWNIYQNRYNNTCVTIRFNDSCPTNSSIKYRKISDNQLNRNIDRAKRFKMSHVQSHIGSNSENSSNTPPNKRKKYEMSPECNRFDKDSPIVYAELTIDSPISVIDHKHAKDNLIETPVSSIDSFMPPSDPTPSIQYHDPVPVDVTHVECEHTNEFMSPNTYAIEPKIIECVIHPVATSCPQPHTYQNNIENIHLFTHATQTDESSMADCGVRSHTDESDRKLLPPPEPPDGDLNSSDSGVRYLELAENGVRLSPQQDQQTPVTQVSPSIDNRSGINCPCCNEIMTVTHVCSDGCDDSKTLPPKAEILPESSVDKIYFPRNVTAPRFTSMGIPNSACETFCVFAGVPAFDSIGHSGVLYYKCRECKIFMCHVCKKSIFNNSVGCSPCCHNICLEITTYGSNLFPRDMSD